MLDFCTFGQKMLSQGSFWQSDLSVKLYGRGQIMLFLVAKLWCECHYHRLCLQKKTPGAWKRLRCIQKMTSPLATRTHRTNLSRPGHAPIFPSAARPSKRARNSQPHSKIVKRPLMLFHTTNWGQLFTSKTLPPRPIHPPTSSTAHDGTELVRVSVPHCERKHKM